MYICAYSLFIGAPERLFLPVESFGHICGSKKQPLVQDAQSMIDKKYLFHLGTDPLKSKSICVSKCPDQSLNSESDLRQWMNSTGAHLCEQYIIQGNTLNIPEVNGDFNNRYLFNEQGPCPALPLFATIPILNKCVAYVTNYTRLTRAHINHFIDGDLSKPGRPFKFKVIAFIKACTADLYRNRILILIVPFVTYVLTYAFVNVALNSNYHELAIWFLVVLGILSIYVLVAFLGWALICQHMYLVKADQVGLRSKIDSINMYLLIFLTVLALVLTLVATLTFFIHNTRLRLMHKTMAILVNSLKVYQSAHAHRYMLSAMFTLGHALTLYFILGHVSGHLITSDTSQIDSSSGYLTFEFAYPSLYIVGWLYIMYMATCFFPMCNINYQSFIICHLVAKFYFSKGEDRKKTPLKSSLAYTFKSLKHFGSIVVLTLLQHVLWFPKMIFALLVHKFVPYSKIAIIGSLESQNRNGRVEKSENLTVGDNSNRKTFQNGFNDEIPKNVYQTLQCKYFLYYPLMAPFLLVGFEKYSYCKSVKKTHAIFLTCPFPMDSICSTLHTLFWLIKLGPMCLSAMFCLVFLQNNHDSYLYSISLLCCSLLFTNYAVSHAILPIEVTIYTTLLCFCEDLRISYSSDTKHLYYTGISLLDTFRRISPLYGPVGYIGT
ncbi:unnamed protein product [Gordionus sp. m RMFG-2023]